MHGDKQHWTLSLEKWRTGHQLQMNNLLRAQLLIWNSLQKYRLYGRMQDHKECLVRPEPGQMRRCTTVSATVQSDSMWLKLLLQLRINRNRSILLYSDQCDMQVFAQQVPAINAWER